MWLYYSVRVILCITKTGLFGAPAVGPPYCLHLRVKFYSSEPNNLHEELTRWAETRTTNLCSTFLFSHTFKSQYKLFFLNELKIIKKYINLRLFVAQKFIKNNLLIVCPPVITPCPQGWPAPHVGKYCIKASPAKCFFLDFKNAIF